MRVLLPFLLLAACADDPDVAPTAPPAPPAARAPEASAPLVGVVASRTSALVTAEVDGRIATIAATSGARVHAGDPLVELDPALLAAHLNAAIAAADAARAERDGARAQVAEARRQLALEARLFRAGAAAEESVRVARATLARAAALEARAEAALHEAEANRDAMQRQAEHARLVAPVDGVVSLVKAQVGEVVAPGQMVARVFDPDHLMIRFQVTRDRHREVAVGAHVQLRVEGKLLDAHVTSVSPDLEPPLDFAIAEADIAPPASDVPVGALGDVQVVP